MEPWQSGLTVRLPLAVQEATAEDTVKAVAKKAEKAQGVAEAAAAAAPPAPPAVEAPPAPAPPAPAAAAAPAPVKEVVVEVVPEAAPAAAAVAEPSVSELRAMTQKAAAAGKVVFTWPPGRAGGGRWCSMCMGGGWAPRGRGSCSWSCSAAVR